MKTIMTLWFFLVGACFGSFALATAWRIRKKKDFVRGRSECEKCHHTLSGHDLIPIVSWLAARGKCRYCRKKMSPLLIAAELAGGMVFASSYLWWPEQLSGFFSIARFIVWCAALVLLFILLFYDLQWFLLPNKVMYPLWALAAVDFSLRFIQEPSLKTVLLLAGSLLIAWGIFNALFMASNGRWIGFGDVRLGAAIGLLLGTPALAGAALFASSLIGLIIVLPSLVMHRRGLKSKIPYGPFLIIALILTRIWGQKVVDWYMAHILLLP